MPCWCDLCTAIDDVDDVSATTYFSFRLLEVNNDVECLIMVGGG